MKLLFFLKTTFIILISSILIISCEKKDDPSNNGNSNTTSETCSDGIKNQDETDIDCGGVCTACVVETCSDGIKNQDETDIDCGGVCNACSTGPSCSLTENTAKFKGFPDKSYSPSCRVNSSDNYEMSSGSLSIEFKEKPTSSGIYNTTSITGGIGSDEVYIYTVLGGTFSYGYSPNRNQNVYVTVNGGELRVEYCDIIFNSPSSDAAKDVKGSANLVCN